MKKIDFKQIIQSVIISAKVEGIKITEQEIRDGLRKYKAELAQNTKEAKKKFYE